MTNAKDICHHAKPRQGGIRMTNAEKFKEVFGFEPDSDSMVVQCPNSTARCKYQWAMGRCHCEEWWQEEFKELETWNGFNRQITAPKGTFDKIWNGEEGEGNDV